MTDLLGIALSGVKAYSRALEVVGNNVANATTAGYVRRTTSFSPIVGGPTGPTEIDRTGGSGVLLTGIGRAIDMLRADTLRRAEGDVAALDTADRWVSGIQAVLGGPSSLDEPLTEFFASVSGLAADPANLAVRGVFLEQARTLADRFNANAAELERIGADIALTAQTEVTTFNRLTQGLAETNAQLRRAAPDSNISASLSDERDKILAEMATYTTLQVNFDERGQATVRIPDAGGPVLVQGDVVRSARIVPAAGGGFQMRLGPTGNDEAATLLNGSFAGLSHAARLHDQTVARLDALADRFAGEMNAIHMAGVDLHGNPGVVLFSTETAVAKPAGGNGGTARITAELADGGAAGPMNLLFDGTQWTLTDIGTGDNVTGDLPLTLGDISIGGSGAARNGDVFRIGIASGAAGIALRNISAQELAVAPPFLAEAAGGNAGDGMIEVRAGPAALPPATGPFDIVADAAGMLHLQDAAGVVLASGMPGTWLSGDGFVAKVAGSVADGDSFRVRETGANSSANGNALAMLALRDQGGVSGTYGDMQDAMITGVSAPLSEIRTRLAVATAARDMTAEALNEASGVDLNTEAAEMLRMQQAYQANARIIQTAREIFDAILRAGA